MLGKSLLSCVVALSAFGFAFEGTRDTAEARHRRRCCCCNNYYAYSGWSGGYAVQTNQCAPSYGGQFNGAPVPAPAPGGEYSTGYRGPYVDPNTGAYIQGDVRTFDGNVPPPPGAQSGAGVQANPNIQANPNARVNPNAQVNPNVQANPNVRANPNTRLDSNTRIESNTTAPPAPAAPQAPAAPTPPSPPNP